MIDHKAALCRNKLLSALPSAKPSELPSRSMHVQRVTGTALHVAGGHIEQVFCAEHSFASMATVADTDDGLLQTAAVRLIADDKLVRECLSESLTDRTKESAP